MKEYEKIKINELFVQRMLFTSHFKKGGCLSLETMIEYYNIQEHTLFKQEKEQ